ncbi:uncharacterized protein LOC143704294 [Siphateles boraxobius]|uniref:uncharacterized protein LOC143704294 n=1 Tax=Siphateles boraxobius TaxID=180520 RepID=UPI004062F1B0
MVIAGSNAISNKMNITMETEETPPCNTTSMQGAKLLTYDAVIYAIQFLFGLPTHSYIVWLIVTGKGTGIASEFFTLNISVCECKDSYTLNISNEAPPTNGACNITDFYIYYHISPYDIVLHIISILFGLPTHSYILWLIATGTGRGIASEFFTLNISVCEIMLCLRSLNTVLGNVFTRPWTVKMFLSGFTFTGRFFQCLMCVERYLAVVHPLTFLKYKPLRYKVACSVVTWIMITICCVLSLELVNPCLMPIFKCLYLSHFIIFLSINLFCCVAVLRALKQSGPGERGREREEENHMKRRAFYLILITTVTLVITYVPSSITALHYMLSTPASEELESMSLTCFFLSGFVQPLLFIHRLGKLPFCRSP